MKKRPSPGHLLMQLLHHNSLHRDLAQQYGVKPCSPCGDRSKKIPQRLLEALRYYVLRQVDFDLQTASRCHISLNSSRAVG